MVNVPFALEIKPLPTIDEQQQQAREILAKLRTKFPTAILAGGAPRDWVMGRIAKDLDFFVPHVIDYANRLAPANILNDCGLTGFSRLGFIGGERAGDYGFDPELYEVTQNLADYDTPVQVMFETVTDIMSILDKFGVSLSQIAWDGENFHSTQIFKDSLEHKSIVETGEIYKTRENYRKKIRAYFPTFRYFYTRTVFYQLTGAAGG